jgi:BolA family transcriptional regulator, general stress-responsive regulator
MKVAEAIRTKLTAALAPAKLTIIDESDRHAGHAGSRPEGETHFQVVLVASAFEGKSRLERQRIVYGVLAAELADRVHALTLKTLTPEEDES